MNRKNRIQKTMALVALFTFLLQQVSYAGGLSLLGEGSLKEKTDNGLGIEKYKSSLSQQKDYISKKTSLEKQRGVKKDSAKQELLAQDVQPATNLEGNIDANSASLQEAADSLDAQREEARTAGADAVPAKETSKQQTEVGDADNSQAEAQPATDSSESSADANQTQSTQAEEARDSEPVGNESEQGHRTVSTPQADGTTIVTTYNEKDQEVREEIRDSEGNVQCTTTHEYYESDKEKEVEKRETVKTDEAEITWDYNESGYATMLAIKKPDGSSATTVYDGTGDFPKDYGKKKSRTEKSPDGTEIETTYGPDGETITSKVKTDPDGTKTDLLTGLPILDTSCILTDESEGVYVINDSSYGYDGYGTGVSGPFYNKPDLLGDSLDPYAQLAGSSQFYSPSDFDVSPGSVILLGASDETSISKPLENPDGSVTRFEDNKDGSYTKITTYPDGTVIKEFFIETIDSDGLFRGSEMITHPDGSGEIIYYDMYGREMYRFPISPPEERKPEHETLEDGTVVDREYDENDKLKKETFTYPDGSKTIIEWTPAGEEFRTIETKPDGTVIITPHILRFIYPDTYYNRFPITTNVVPNDSSDEINKDDELEPDSASLFLIR